MRRHVGVLVEHRFRRGHPRGLRALLSDRGPRGEGLIVVGVAKGKTRMPNYLEVEVSLEHITPRIWRRFLIRDRATFLDLHHAIQHACGWEDTHLFAFRDADGAVVAGMPNDIGFGPPDPDAAKVRAGDYLRRRWSVLYEYDFGDSWQHMVELKEVVASAEKFIRRLLDGARVFPPEDCGGMPGYEDLLAVASLSLIHISEPTRPY